MKLYKGKIPIIAAEITRVLTEEGDIEAEDNSEVEKDIEAILKEYMRVEREIEEEAKDRIAKLGLSYSEFSKTKRVIAKEREFGLGDDGITYIINQMIQCFMQSNNVAEVYSDDPTLTVKIRSVLRKHMSVDEDIDRLTREKLKNLEEGSREWDVQYNKVREEIKRKMKLT